MAVELILSFDTEDYETPAADDAELIWAQMLARYGLPGCFCVVGEEARALRDRRRRDVLAAIARHEVAYHSDLHSVHPTHAEYLDTMGWSDGVQAVLDGEAAGIADLRSLLGQQPSAYCKPGNSWGPQVAHAMALLNVPVFCDAPFELAPGRPLWYTGSLFIGYHLAFDAYFDLADRLPRMQADFRAAVAERERDGGLLVMYTHPCRLVTSAFSDTFRFGRNPPRSEWGPAPLRPRAQVEELQRDFDAFLCWVVEEGGVVPTTYRAQFDRYRPQAAPWLSRPSLLALSRDVGTGPLDAWLADGVCLSPAEQFCTLVWAAAYVAEHGAIPADLPILPLLGPQAPAVDTFEELREVAAGQAVAALRAAHATASLTGMMPTSVPLNGGIAPATAMRLAAAYLLATELKGECLPAQEMLGVPGGPREPALAQRPDIGDHSFQGWTIHPPDFRGDHVRAMTRLQAWTAKPALPNPR
jgi:hypothetical protein